jgi:hypothetical protein
VNSAESALNVSFESVVECSCPNDCPRHGRCDECRAFHATTKYPPYCEREHKSSFLKRLFGS